MALKASKTFKIGNGNFYSYWKKCCYNLIGKYIASHHSMLDSDFLSLDKNVIESSSLHDAIGEVDKTPEINLLYDTFISIINDPSNDFSDDEIRIITLFLDGYPMKEIAMLLNMKVGRVYYKYKVAVDKIGFVMQFPKKKRY